MLIYNVPMTFGMKHSPEAKEKMRAAKLGRKQSPEHTANMKAANLRKKLAQQQVKQLPLF